MPGRRSKRGWVNAIGRLSHFLFGTMDDEDAETIYNKLDKLDKHDEENTALLKRGVALIRSNAQTLSDAIGNLTQREEELDQKMEQFYHIIENKIGQLAEEVKAIHIQTEINQIVLFIISKLTQIHKYLNDHFAIISQLNQHKLSPLVVSNMELRRVLRKLHGNQSEDKLTMDPTIIGQTATIETFLLSKSVVVQIKLPVIDADAYTINQVYPIPLTWTETSYSVIDLPEDYILNNTQKGTYLEMDEKAFGRNCMRLKSVEGLKIFLCKQTQPLTIKPDPSNCILNLFHNPYHEPPSCTHRIGKVLPNQLQKLGHPNAWLYISASEQTLLVHCAKEYYQVPLQNVGILTLKADCRYQYQNLLLPFESQQSVSLDTHQPSVFDVPRLTVNKAIANALLNESVPTVLPRPIPNVKRNRYATLMQRFRSDTKSIDELEKDLANLELRRQLEKTSKQQTLQTYVGAPVITIVLLLVGIKIFLKARRHFKKDRDSGTVNHIVVSTSPNNRQEEIQLGKMQQQMKEKEVIGIPQPEFKPKPDTPVTLTTQIAVERKTEYNSKPPMASEKTGNHKLQAITIK